MKDLSIKKLYYSISEVSKITGLEQYVLRYWENEFEELKPSKNRAGNRIYTNKDIKLIMLVKRLLRDEKYTLDGAKQILKTYDPNEDNSFQITDQIDTQKAPAEVSPTEKTEASTQPAKIDNTLIKDLLEIKSLLETIYNKL